MIDKSAIEALQQSAAISTAGTAIACALGDPQMSEDTRGALALPNDFSITDLESYLPCRRRLRGKAMTPVAASFAEYVAAHAETGATVFVDPDQMSATAVLNLGTPDAPGHADNLAIYKPPRTAAYAALLATATGSAMPQMKAAEFVEDWAPMIECLDADGSEIKTSRAVAAIRRMTIESLRKLESEQASLSSTTSTFESVQAKSAEPIPAQIRFTCVPLQGLPPRAFLLRLGVMTGDKAPGIVLRVIKLEEHQESMARDLALQIKAAMEQAASEPEAPPCARLVIGTYQRGT